jgi:hypothetical protein
MKQPIAGLTPAEVAEATVMTVWPSVAAYRSGQWLGRLCAIRWPNIYIVRLGNLLALLGAPLGLVLYFCRILPRLGIRYVLTNRRVVVLRGLQGVEARSIALNAFEDLRIDVRPGQAWFQAGDLVFCHSGQEVFRLAGIVRPETFRQVCAEARGAVLSVQQVLQHQAASV